jgi:hypothetical protein
MYRIKLIIYQHNLLYTCMLYNTSGISFVKNKKEHNIY